jgi:hypothetical protein
VKSQKRDPLDAKMVFSTRHRPVQGARGHFRAAMRRGVNRVTWGSRYTLGVIFDDAQ